MGIKEEIDEIYQEMKEDFKKGKEYAYQYRKTIFWIFMAFITMQFTDILSLGSSWHNICQQNPNFNIKKQKGGAESNVEKNKPKTEGEKTKAEGEKTKAEGEKTKAEGEKTTAEGEKTTAEGEKTTAEGEKTKPDGEAVKDTGKFNKSSFKAGKPMKLKPFESFRSLGPISGFMGKIGNFIKGGFFIIGIIIAILFISFIPILVFCTAMYYILKFIAKKIAIL